jgi:hypothetical protein
MTSFDPKRKTAPFVAVYRLTAPGQFQSLKATKMSDGSSAFDILNVQGRSGIVKLRLNDPDTYRVEGPQLLEVPR